MYEIFNQILEACRLARELEMSLPHIANNPALLLAFCEQVCNGFKKADYDLRGILGGSSGQFDPAGLMGFAHLGGSMSMGQQVGFSQLGLEFTGSEQERGVGPEAGGSLGRASTGQRMSRTRREKGDTRTVRIPAIQAGNLKLPPDDGYTWRKYGQKIILGSRFPRSYFRCTHKNFYGCKAKKKVQKLDADPKMYEITYCGNHTCNTSPTPLILPSITPTGNENTVTDTAGAITGPSLTPAVFRPFLSSHEVGESSRPHVPDQLEPPQPVGMEREGFGSVTDLADAMFNSGSSSNNSIETIFSFKKDN